MRGPSYTLLDAQTLLNAYRMGVFPMAHSRDDPGVDWHMGFPSRQGMLRACFLFDTFHVSRSLRKTLRRAPYTIAVDEDFEGVIQGCAAMERPRGGDSWINRAITEAFIDLFRMGVAHSIACRDSAGVLVGGVYGVCVGGIFCGESLFSLAPEAGKIALTHLVARLWRGGFSLVEIQQVTDFTRPFGAQWISLSDYLDALEALRDVQADFSLPGVPEGQILQDYLAFLEQGPTPLSHQ